MLCCNNDIFIKRSERVVYTSLTLLGRGVYRALSGEHKTKLNSGQLRNVFDKIRRVRSRMNGCCTNVDSVLK